MKNISIIVAIAANNAIGKDNLLLWHISDDLKRFKKITTGHTVIMGKKTYFSLPLRPLPNRRNIVITDVAGEKIPDCITVYSIPEALEWCNTAGECFIIGGGSVYKQFMEHADTLYITYVDKDFDADTFFPEINACEWKLTEEEPHFCNENGFSYFFRKYVRIL